MSTTSGAIGLYVHIPFCRSKCLYCDFNSYAGAYRHIPSYLSALSQEAHLWSPLLANHDVSTLYVGGGTPTLLNSRQLARLIHTLHDCFTVSHRAEITVEANPESTSKPLLDSLRDIGVNRLSIGVQSFSDTELKMLGRPHSADEARQAFGIAREAGFENVNIDLIYGLPRQTLQQWHITIEQAINLHPEHLSLYSLTLEPKTPLAQMIAHGLIPAPDPDLAADMYQLAEAALGDAGYHHYEISNWAIPGRECRHNVKYWKNRTYIGIGAGAHSHFNACRFANVTSPDEYTRRVRQHEFKLTNGLPEEVTAAQPWITLATGGWPVTAFESLAPATIMADTLILGLRLVDGLDIRALPSYLNESIEAACGDEISRLVADGLLEKKGSIIRLSAKGRLLSNEVFVRLLLQLRDLHGERSIRHEPAAQASR
jgi:oxygen-independent coproporphyrinogen-3 oxidase